MNDEPTPEDAKQAIHAYWFPEKQPVQSPECSHRYRIVVGRKMTIRYCSRCGVSWILADMRDVTVTRDGVDYRLVGATWLRIEEEASNV